MLRANYHTHTTFCDGADSAEDMVRAAVDLGLVHLGLSGHMDPDIHMDWPAYVAEVGRLAEAYADRIDVLMGVELDTVYDRGSCPGAEYVIGSTHFVDADPGLVFAVDASAEVLSHGCDEVFGGDWYALARAYYDVESRVVDATGCTFVGHFDLVTRFNDETHDFDESDPRYTTPALECMEHLVSQGVPFEINCGAINRGRKAEPYPRRELLRALHDLGGEILVNSDAHDAQHLVAGFDQAIAEAVECGFTHTNVLAHDLAGNVEMRQVALDAL